MASLNLSLNGPSISKGYQSVINAPPPAGSAAASSMYGHWAIFSVSTPLVNAFQPEAGGKESVLKVQSTGEGELTDLVEEFSEGKIQFAFVKIRDPNTGLPKNVLIGWCGEGVPERTKGYFTSHSAAVSRFLHGYHVQITARSEVDLTPEGILQKVADASGAKYASPEVVRLGNTTSKPPIATKPVFTPSRSGGAVSNPVTNSRRTVATRDAKVDEDGWGADAPPVTRTQLEKVPSAYQPTKVNMQELTSQNPTEPTSRNIESDNDARRGIVKGGYQPIGKVDIAAIRRQAQDAGEKVNQTPEPVKGAYEPTGKVDIAAIRAKAQKPSDISYAGAQDPERLGDQKTLSERPGPFQSAERLTTLPKPKVSNRFAGGPTFTGTKAPLPGDFAPKVSPAATPVGSASRTFADEGGKTPAQLWAERKAKERGLSDAGDVSISSSSAPTHPGDGEWRSSYTGKTWAPVHTSHTGLSTTSSVSQHSAGRSGEVSQESESKPPSGAVGSVRDQFTPAPSVGGGHKIPIPGFLTGPVESVDVYEGETKRDVPNPPQQPRSPTPPTPSIRDSSPIRVAMPVSRNAPEEMVQDAREEQHSPPRALPIRSLEQAVPNEEELEEPTHDTARETAEATVHDTAQSLSISAVAQYDYEKAEDNEIELKEGEYVTEIEMVDKDWWLGVNASGERGLFPSNYVEPVEVGNGTQQATSNSRGHGLSEPGVEASKPAEEHFAPEIAGPDSASGEPTATALYDYEAAEDNEISFPDGAKIINIEFPDEDWWSGEYNGKIGLFPANYVQLDE